jgi:hypothetical protein
VGDVREDLRIVGVAQLAAKTAIVDFAIADFAGQGDVGEDDIRGRGSGEAEDDSGETHVR